VLHCCSYCLIILEYKNIHIYRRFEIGKDGNQI